MPSSKKTITGLAGKLAMKAYDVANTPLFYDQRAQNETKRYAEQGTMNASATALPADIQKKKADLDVAMECPKCGYKGK